MALGLRLERPARVVAPDACLRAGAGNAGPVSFTVMPGGAVVVKGASGPVTARRFSGVAVVPIGTASPAQPVLIRIPPDRARDRPWRVTASGASVRVCRAG